MSWPVLESLSESPLPPFFLGIFVGQFMFLVVLMALVYYFFLGPPKKIPQNNDLRLLEKLDTTNRLEQADQDICQAVSYVPQPTEAESCGWLNVMIAQVVHKYRGSPDFHRLLIDTLDSTLNARRPSVLGPVTISSISLGKTFPRLSKAAVRSLQDEKKETLLATEIVISYNDSIQIGLETQVLVNFRGAPIASLPVSLTVSLVNVSGIVSPTPIPACRLVFFSSSSQPSFPW